jgi:hypothetical protein
VPAYKYAFSAPEYVEHTIIDADTRNVIGVLRLKPSSILWKPHGRKQFRQASVDEFGKWILSRRRKRKQ